MRPFKTLNEVVSLVIKDNSQHIEGLEEKIKRLELELRLEKERNRILTAIIETKDVTKSKNRKKVNSRKKKSRSKKESCLLATKLEDKQETIDNTLVENEIEDGIELDEFALELEDKGVPPLKDEGWELDDGDNNVRMGGSMDVKANVVQYQIHELMRTLSSRQLGPTQTQWHVPNLTSSFY